MIPEKYFIHEKTITHPGEGKGYFDGTPFSVFRIFFPLRFTLTLFVEKEKMWVTTVFPSARPSNRREVLLLDQWLTKMLEETIPKTTDMLGINPPAYLLFCHYYFLTCEINRGCKKSTGLVCDLFQ
jgi:hypothetical protein